MRSKDDMNPVIMVLVGVVLVVVLLLPVLDRLDTSADMRGVDLTECIWWEER